MDMHELARALDLDPEREPSLHPPPVDDVRPRSRLSCGATARQGTRVVLQGHGVRSKPIITAQARDDGSLALVRTRCWERRYLCARCGKSTVAVPIGVLVGSAYTVPAIVLSWLSIIGWGGGRGERPAPTRPRAAPVAPQRWRSPYRWLRDERVLSSLFGWTGHWSHRLLAGLVQLARLSIDMTIPQLLRTATRIHVQRGVAM